MPLRAVRQKSLSGFLLRTSIIPTVGINNAANAAYLAVEILAVKYPDLRKKLVEFRAGLADEAKYNGGMGVTL